MLYYFIRMPDTAKSQDQYILSLDEGTTSARALVFDYESRIVGMGQHEFRQIYPRPGWVEHDPEEIWEALRMAFKDAIQGAEIKPRQVAAIGITNQRETTILWERSSCRPVYNAIVWQCRRTADYSKKLKDENSDLFKAKTGLIPDSYFSGPKIRWLLSEIPTLRERAYRGEIAFGTVDSFLINRLTGGSSHVIDYSNASRTMLFNIKTLEWDVELLEILDIPEEILPEPRPSSSIIGYTDPEVFGASVPIAGDVGDQQSALFGHTAFETGDTKCTYGTGNFLLTNTGKTASPSQNLLTTIAWGIGREITYALEGSVFITGGAVQWLMEPLGIITDPSEVEELATSLESNDGVYFVPAFVGLGAPYWDQYARGVIVGLTRGTGRAHIARATLESIAYLTADVVNAMEKETDTEIEELWVDGGASRNQFLMQFQADILKKKIVTSPIQEITAQGAAYIAGLTVDYWGSQDELKKMRKIERIHEPQMEDTERKLLYQQWMKAVKKSLVWTNHI